MDAPLLETVWPRLRAQRRYAKRRYGMSIDRDRIRWRYNDEANRYLAWLRDNGLLRFGWVWWDDIMPYRLYIRIWDQGPLRGYEARRCNRRDRRRAKEILRTGRCAREHATSLFRRERLPHLD